jgi:hypothetical protein
MVREVTEGPELIQVVRLEPFGYLTHEGIILCFLDALRRNDDRPGSK